MLNSERLLLSRNGQKNFNTTNRSSRDCDGFEREIFGMTQTSSLPSPAKREGLSIEGRKRLLKARCINKPVIPTTHAKVVRASGNITLSYEETLFRSRPIGSTPRIPFQCDVTISGTKGKGVPPTLLFRQRIPGGAFLPFPEMPSCPFCARITLPLNVPITSQCTLQMIIRDERGAVGKIFFVHLNIQDMPEDSQTIIRQHHYYDNLLAEEKRNILKHGLQVMLKRSRNGSLSKADNSDGQSTILEEKIHLMNSIRVLFSFEQKASLMPHCEFDERLRIETVFPIPGKYWSLKETFLPTVIGRECLQPHGEIR